MGDRLRSVLVQFAAPGKIDVALLLLTVMACAVLLVLHLSRFDRILPGPPQQAPTPTAIEKV